MIANIGFGQRNNFAVDSGTAADFSIEYYYDIGDIRTGKRL